MSLIWSFTAVLAVIGIGSFIDHFRNMYSMNLTSLVVGAGCFLIIASMWLGHSI